MLNSLLLLHPKNCYTMHADRKCTSTINQTASRMIDDILENKLELKDLGVAANNHLTLSNHIAEKVWSLYGQPFVKQISIKLKRC